MGAGPQGKPREKRYVQVQRALCCAPSHCRNEFRWKEHDVLSIGIIVGGLLLFALFLWVSIRDGMNGSAYSGDTPGNSECRSCAGAHPGHSSYTDFGGFHFGGGHPLYPCCPYCGRPQY
jgi:hypothetical protein